MKVRMVAVWASLFLAALALLAAAPAWAVLGESVSTVQSDRQRLQGQLVAEVRQGYSLHQIKAAGGRIVREYVSPQGTVFGVAWQGPMMPDLHALLGSYFAEFQQAAQSQHRHGPLVVRGEHVVVESGGHMRGFRGRAYVPSLVPETLTQAVVQ